MLRCVKTINNIDVYIVVKIIKINGKYDTFSILFFRHHHRHHSRHKHNEREIFIPKDDLQMDENLDEFLQDDLTSNTIVKIYV